MKMKTAAAALMAAVAASAVRAETGREAFVRQQAYEAVQRVAGQVDVLEQNQNDLSARVSKLENGGGEIAALKAEIAALKSELARLRSEMQAQRSAIVNDITSRIDKQEREHRAQIERENAARRPPPETAVPAGPRKEYVVRSGDTLSLIAQAFGTTVGKIKQMNGLKTDNIRVGQKLFVPAK